MFPCVPKIVGAILRLRQKKGKQVSVSFIYQKTTKIRSDLLRYSYCIHTPLNLFGSIFLYKKPRKIILKKINSMEGLKNKLAKFEKSKKLPQITVSTQDEMSS